MNKNRILAFAALSMAALSACGADGEADLTRSGELMFGLNDGDVEQIHARYLEDEDIDLTFARLTAPFDCELYDDLCEQVGETQALAITGELVDLALDEATPDTIDSYLDERLLDAMAENETPDTEDVAFRASSQSNWAYDEDEGTRLRVHTGITTPLIGKRKAWTEANTQASGSGPWHSWNASLLCVNPGANTQTFSFCGGGSPCNSITIENENPGNHCIGNSSWHRRQTSHDRNKGRSFSGGFWTRYRLYSRGCATATIEGYNLSACGPTHSRAY